MKRFEAIAPLAATTILMTLVGNTSAAPLTFEAAVNADNPVAHWRLDEAPGASTLIDNTGSHNGTYFNGPIARVPGVTFGPEPTDNGGDFDDSSSQYAQVPDSPAFDFLDFTLEAIIRLENPTDVNNRIISQQGSNFWLLHVRDISGNFQLTHWSSLDGISGVGFGPDLNDGQFHHVAITRDTVNDVTTWYVDGVDVGSVAIASNTAYSINADPFIGAFNGGSQFFPGVIDEVALFNTALSAERIAVHFNSLSLPVPEPATGSLLLMVGLLGVRRSRRARQRAGIRQAR